MTPQAAERLRHLEGEFELLYASRGGLLWGGASGGGGARLRMAGELLSRTGVLEVLGAIEATGWRGVLHVFGPTSHRELTLQEGALLYARSDQPADRLGQVMLRLGALEEEDLRAALERVDEGRHLGEVLVERGVLDEARVLHYLQQQAQQIFFDALVVSDGWYVFVEPEEETQPPVALHLPVQPLLMEGVQRIDEMSLFRQRIPHGAVCPQAVKLERKASLDGRALQVLPYCDGQHRIEDIARLTGLGEFETTKIVYHLLQQGLVVLRSGTRLDPDRVRRVVNRFDDVMQDVFLAAATYGEMARTREKLQRWLAESPAGRVLGPSIEEDGALDSEEVLRRLESLEDAQPLDRLHQALRELATYALVVVGRVLSRREEMALARDVRHRLDRLLDVSGETG